MNLDKSTHRPDEPWDPATRVSFPRNAFLDVRYRHGELQLGVAVRDDKGWNPEHDALGFFVRVGLLAPSWYRISEADYMMLHGRLKADPTCEVEVEARREDLGFTFGKVTRVEVLHHHFTDAEDEDDRLRERMAS
jgi:hypothetical protein